MFAAIKKLFTHQPAYTQAVSDVTFPGWIKTAGNYAPFTPDLAALEESEFQLLFTADGLMKGRSGYHIIGSNSARLAEAFTYSVFDMYVYDNREDPVKAIILRPNNSILPPRKIRGQLHAIESGHIAALDMYYKNKVEFKRKRVRILLPFKPIVSQLNRSVNGKPLPPVLAENYHKITLPEHMYLATAWMYLAQPDHWSHLIDGGFTTTPAPRITPGHTRVWLPEYQFYPPDNAK